MSLRCSIGVHFSRGTAVGHRRGFPPWRGCCTALYRSQGSLTALSSMFIGSYSLDSPLITFPTLVDGNESVGKQVHNQCNVSLLLSTCEDGHSYRIFTTLLLPPPPPPQLPPLQHSTTSLTRTTHPRYIRHVISPAGARCGVRRVHGLFEVILGLGGVAQGRFTK